MLDAYGTFVQAVMVLTALTLARDEIFWLFKHNSMPPPKGKHRPNPEDYNDPALPELVYLIVELKGTYMNTCRSGVSCCFMRESLHMHVVGRSKVVSMLLSTCMNASI